MFGNYLKIAFRVTLRQRLVSLINIVGFALALAVCFFMFLFAKNELSYDSWIPGAEQVYRMESTTHVPGRAPKPVAQAPGIARDFLKDEFDEITEAVRVIPYPLQRSIVRLNGEPFRIQRTLVDDGFFDVFPLNFVAGSRDTALADNNSYVVTEEAAIQLFGTTDVLGKIIEANDPLTGEPVDYTITGVLEDLPSNTHLSVSILARFDPIKFKDARSLIGSWFLRNTYLYFKLRSPEDIPAVRAAMPDFITRHVDTNASETLSALTPNEFMEFHLVALPDIYLHSGRPQQMNPTGDIDRVRIFLFAAAMVLAVAIINYANLATARFGQRVREIGIRKVAGASRQNLVVQFLGEAIIIALISLLVALSLMELTLPTYNALSAKALATSGVFSPDNLVIYVATALVAGLLAGLYPAITLSGLAPGKILKGDGDVGAAGGLGRGQLRNMFVILQFAISVGLIISVLIIREQVGFAQSADLGFNRSNMMVVRLAGANDSWQTLRDELTRHPAIKGAAATSNAPTDEGESQINMIAAGPEGPVQRAISFVRVDGNFFDVMGVEFLAGQGLDSGDEIASPDDPDNEPEGAEAPVQDIVVNESGLALFGFGSASEAVGREVSRPDGERSRIIGVIPDLYYRSVHEEVRPTAYGFDENFSTLLIDVETGEEQEVIEFMGELWQGVRPDLPLTYNFTDQLLDDKYQGEIQQLELLGIFAGIAVFIAAIGVFGMALFTVERRTREIGIRKILGARVRDIVRLFAIQFSKPVLLSSLIAWPITFYFMQSWLNGFAYRVDMTATPFLVASLSALTVALATVAGHAIRVARANPIKALRYE